MFSQKYKYLQLFFLQIPIIVILLSFVFLLFSVLQYSASAQAGCGDSMGPPSPGTICPDGSIPLLDSALPIGCPGSSNQGPSVPGTVCPERPGRPACHLDGAKCLDSNGVNVAGSNSSKESGIEESGIEADCTMGADSENCGITRYLVLLINTLSILAGIVITGSIAYGGIQYSMAGDDPQKVSEAKNRIRNAIIALLFFIFGYGILDYLVPGGLFR